MEGEAVIKALKDKGYRNIANLDLAQGEPDLRNHGEVKYCFNEIRPEFVFVFAGKSGGILANQKRPATLMLDNLQVLGNVLSLAHEYRVTKLLYLASSCVYPKKARQPMRPDMLMTGPLEPTNSAYATSKLAGIELCRSYRREHGDNFISAIPANIFGPGDDFSEEDSHVVAALLRKMHKAKQNGDEVVQLWGTGKPRREFIYVEDLADACLFLVEHYSGDDPVNVGTGTAMSIAAVAETLKEVTGYRGQLQFDDSKPDGMPEKALDSSYLFSLGWKRSNSFRVSVEKTYNSFTKSLVSSL